ncbi:MAG: universal stress protein [Puia sp.]|nr:universal stress protein [Puia sp.]
MKTILVPVNFSAGSDNAARYAADMALAIHADLHLIHVLQVPVSMAEIPISDTVFVEMQQTASESLIRLREELVKRTKGQVPISSGIEVGGVEYQVEEYCSRKPPFAVIMGNSGTPMERALAGSRVSVAIHHLPYPLIVVPENASFHDLKRIVLACDVNDMEGGIPVAISFLKELRNIFHARFDVVNISTRKQDRQQEAEASFGFDLWKDRLQEIYPEVHFVRTDKLTDGIGEYLAGHPADLLLVFPKRHSFLEFHASQAKKIAYRSSIPVMSIHA